MKFKADTILISIVVAIAASFLMALAMLLLKTIKIAPIDLDQKLFLDLTINLFILIVLGIFVLIKGSSLAAWLLYRHDVTWGYRLDKKRVFPILIMSFVMTAIIFSAVYAFGNSELDRIVYLQRSFEALERISNI